MFIRRLLHPFSATTSTRRGQSFVEFALLLPVLLVLVLGTVDLGRAYFASVSLENAVKEGAFFGAREPECASVGATCPNPSNVKARVDLEMNGMPVTNFQAKCFAPGTTVFTGAGKALSACADGDLYYVASKTPFTLVTPLIAGLLGNTLTLSSDATSVVVTSFDSGSGTVPIPTTSPTGSPPPGSCTVPDFKAGPTKISGAVNVWVNVGGFQASKITTSGPNGQNIVWQSVPAGTVGPCLTQTITVSNTVMATPTPAPTPSPTPVPTATPTPGPGSPTPTPSATAVPTVTPTPTAQCTVPVLTGKKITVAQGDWSIAGFKAANFTAVRPPNNDYTVASQTIGVGQVRPCLTTTIQVDN
ncbi:MAG: TadE/TadG family type IV pilus assembly protein [Candidatus Limnocylindria bacterium]